jgi:hypothetical protein
VATSFAPRQAPLNVGDQAVDVSDAVAGEERSGRRTNPIAAQAFSSGSTSV